jgi:hypothetical protein
MSAEYQGALAATKGGTENLKTTHHRGGIPPQGESRFRQKTDSILAFSM